MLDDHRGGAAAERGADVPAGTSSAGRAGDARGVEGSPAKSLATPASPRWSGRAAKGKRAPKRAKYEYEVAPDVQRDLEEIVRLLPDEFPHVDVRRVVCYRSRGAKARIYARIWALPGIISHALGVEPHYVIEVVERYDRATKDERERTLLHELLHIPKTFSGALVPHKCFGKNIDCAAEGRLHKKLVLARELETRSRLAARALVPASLDDFA